MSNAPVFEIDLSDFERDPYPTLARMRAEAPIAYVPQLGATLLTRRDDIHAQEKRIEVFSSHQPGGLMTRLMGENMMRKDGEAHMRERRALFPALNPRTVAQHWKPLFQEQTQRVLECLRPLGRCDFVTDFAMPVSAGALKSLTGLTRMRASDMDKASQAMIDGCANYANDPNIETRCHDATRLIDRHIDLMLPEARDQPDALSAMQGADLPIAALRANIKLIISGGQNEPRDAIAGTAFALLSHPDQKNRIMSGQIDWAQGFAEYVRWMSPIGMSPRQIARKDMVENVRFEVGDRVFLMFGSAGHDERHFRNPTVFNIDRNTQAAIGFGAGPHFCAGAAASRCLVAQVALPLAFANLPNLRLTGDVRFHGWAFRGPVQMPVAWDP